MGRVTVKKLIAALVIGASLVIAVPAFAGSTTVPDGVVGTYVQHEQGGYKITVGFSPCGHDFYTFDDPPVLYHDPLAQFYAKVQKGQGSSVSVWAHDITDLNATVVDSFGFGLSADAVVALQQDAATYTCAT